MMSLSWERVREIRVRLSSALMTRFEYARFFSQSSRLSHTAAKAMKLWVRRQQNGRRKHYLFQGLGAAISRSNPSLLGG